MSATTLDSLREHKEQGRKFSCVAAYDACFARLLCTAGVKVLLVGDSLGMVLQGHSSTLPVTIAQMIYHTRCVRQGNQNALVLADMPLASYPSPDIAVRNAARLMRAGAQAVKIEGGAWLSEIVASLTRQGIPCCAHLGLQPQSVHLLGGFRVQGRDPDHARTLMADALALEQAGARLLVLECVPAELAGEITAALRIPVIGIGAGPATDAQILVLHDLLGLNPSPPRFIRNFLSEGHDIASALAAFVEAVEKQEFPAAEHCYH